MKPGAADLDVHVGAGAAGERGAVHLADEVDASGSRPFTAGRGSSAIDQFALAAGDFVQRAVDLRLVRLGASGG